MPVVLPTNFFLSKVKSGIVRYSMLILLSVSIIAAYLFLIKSNNPRMYALYHYNSYSTYSLRGSSVGSGMSFEKPSEVKKMSSSNIQAEFVQQWNSNDSNGETYIAALSQHLSPRLNKKAVTNIAEVINKPDDPNYKNMVSPALTFIKQRMPSGWSTSVSSSIRFESSNIKNDAWKFDFTSKKGDSKLQGSILYMINEGNYYYLLIASNSHNWLANTSAWQRVFNSVTIDQ